MSFRLGLVVGFVLGLVVSFVLVMYAGSLLEEGEALDLAERGAPVRTTR